MTAEVGRVGEIPAYFFNAFSSCYNKMTVMTKMTVMK